MSDALWINGTNLLLGLTLITILGGVAFLARPPKRSKGYKPHAGDHLRIVFVLAVLSFAGFVVLGMLGMMAFGEEPTTRIADLTATAAVRRAGSNLSRGTHQPCPEALAASEPRRHAVGDIAPQTRFWTLRGPKSVRT